MPNPAGKPKPAFFIAVLVVVAGLVGLAFYRFSAKHSDSQQQQNANIDLNSIKKQSGSGGGSQAENPDPNGVTTVKEYSFEPATRLPQVPGTADYTALGKPRDVVITYMIHVIERRRMKLEQRGQRRGR